MRDKNEAALVKNELQNWGSRRFIFLIKIAYLIAMLRKELAWVLKACLNVAERPILNAIATALLA